MKKIALLIALNLIVIQLSSVVHVRAQERPRRDREADGAKRPPEKADKWDKGQKKGEFKRAVDGEVRERKEPERRNRTGDVARRVDKTTKWGNAKATKLDPGKHTEKFNDVANPKSPGGGGGSKTGGGGSAPPSAPGPKPPRP